MSNILKAVAQDNGWDGFQSTTAQRPLRAGESQEPEPQNHAALTQSMERIQQLEAEVARLRLIDAEREAVEYALAIGQFASDLDREVLRALLVERTR